MGLNSMSDASTNNKAAPKEIKAAEEMWEAFTKLFRRSTIAIVLILAAMAAFLV